MHGCVFCALTLRINCVRIRVEVTVTARNWVRATVRAITGVRAGIKIRVRMTSFGGNILW